MRRFCLALALFWVLGTQALWAQPAATFEVPPLGEGARVSLLTILPGDGPADAFGHSALRVHAPALGLDRTYNYGTYDFRDPLFLPKFVYGRLTYVVSTAPFRPFVRRYRRLGRPVIEQRLALTPAQQQRLFTFLEWNTLPQNRAYRYDFLFDNCATRIRDAVATAISSPGPEVQSFPVNPDSAAIPPRRGDRLRLGLDRLPRRTFRHHLDRSVAGMPLVDFGFDLALGLPTDRTATAREAMFLPEYLMEAFAGATVASTAPRSPDDSTEATTTGADARAAIAPGPRPLVARTDTLFWVRGARFPARAAFPWPALVTWALLAAVLGGTAWRWWQGRPPTRWPDVLLFGVVGVSGIVIWFLGFLSEHQVTHRNLNVLWILPTHLVLAGALALGRGGGRWARGYLWVTGAAALVLAFGWPFWPQDLHVAAWPLALLLAARAARRTVPGPATASETVP